MYLYSRPEGKAGKVSEVAKTGGGGVKGSVKGRGKGKKVETMEMEALGGRKEVVAKGRGRRWRGKEWSGGGLEVDAKGREE